MNEIEQKPSRIWVTDIPFRKNGSPVIGTFGARIGPVVIINLSTWQRLCAEIPDLASRQFEVGTFE